ncbi:MAG: hypothetical protein ABEJ42_00250 [Halobacteriaceae archaeon]
MTNIGLSPSRARIGSYRQQVVDIGVHPDKWVSDIPDVVDDIPVQISFEYPAVFQTHNGGCKGTQNFDPVPGGVKIKAGHGSEGSCACTHLEMGSTSKWYMMTAAHVTDYPYNYGCDPGKNVRVDQNGQRIGEVVKGDWSDDWALFEVGSNSQVSGFEDQVWFDEDGGGQYRTMWSHYTRDGLQELSTSTLVSKQGWASGFTMGTKHKNEVAMQYSRETFYNGCDIITSGNGVDYGFVTNGVSANGDSGGATFTEHDGGTYIDYIGHHVAGYDGTAEDTRSFCENKEATAYNVVTPAWYLEQYHNIVPF